MCVSRGRLLRRALGAMLVTGSLALSAGALAAPGGQGQGKALGLAQAAGNGNPHHSAVSGKSHTKGSAGSSHQGSAPHGVATGYGGSGGGAGAVVSSARQSTNAGGGGSSSSTGNGPKGKTTICHATGSTKNPYVVITPANPGVENGHAGHQDGRDVIPAPAGATKGPHATGCVQGSTPVVPPTTTSNPPGQQGVLGTVQSGGNPGEQQVAGAVSGGGNPAAGAAANAAGGPKGELPFTGLAASLLLTVGAILLFGGWLVRSLGLRGEPEKS